MSIKRWAARPDSTRQAIVDALRAYGCTVYDLRMPVDLLVGYQGQTLLIECKRLEGKRDPKPTKHTKAQITFLSMWTGGPVATVTDAEGAIRAVRAMEGVTVEQTP